LAVSYFCRKRSGRNYRKSRRSCRYRNSRSGSRKLFAPLYLLKLAHDKVEEGYVEKLKQAIQSEEIVTFTGHEELKRLLVSLKERYLNPGNFHSYKEYEEAVNKELSPIERMAYGKAVGEVENQLGKFIFTATDAEWEGGYHSPTVMWIHNGKHNGKSEILTGLKTNEPIQLIKKVRSRTKKQDTLDTAYQMNLNSI